MKKIYLYALLFTLSANCIAQEFELSWDAPEFSEEVNRIYIPPPDNYRNVATVEIIVNYIDVDGGTDSLGNPIIYTWPEEAIAAFEYATTIWESILVSTKRIR